MTNGDNVVRQSGSAEQGDTECESVANPPIDRWVIWDAANNDWDISATKKPKKGHKKPIVLPDESGGHEIHFHLMVPGESGWQFDPIRPIWSADNAPCGTLTANDSDQLTLTFIGAHLLKVWDKNDGEARLVRYQLNFSNNKGGPVPKVCDPAILNGGGGRI